MTMPFVAGLGSHHGDDQAGWLVIEELRKRGFPPNQLARILHPADLLDLIHGQESLVICDACMGKDSPGKIRRMNWRRASFLVPAGSTTSGRDHGRNGSGDADWQDERGNRDRPCNVRHAGSHDLSLQSVMELGWQLDCFPVAAEIWAIEGNDWTPGHGPSAAVQAAAVSVAETLWKGCFDA